MTDEFEKQAAINIDSQTYSPMKFREAAICAEAGRLRAEARIEALLRTCNSDMPDVQEAVLQKLGIRDSYRKLDIRAEKAEALLQEMGISLCAVCGPRLARRAAELISLKEEK